MKIECNVAYRGIAKKGKDKTPIGIGNQVDNYFSDYEVSYQLRINKVASADNNSSEVMRTTEWLPLTEESKSTRNIHFAGVTFSFREDLREIFMPTNTVII